MDIPADYIMPNCYYGEATMLKVSWTDANPSRRFYGCRKFRMCGECNFFQWHDPPMPNHVKHVIMGLLRRIKESEDMNNKSNAIWWKVVIGIKPLLLELPYSHIILTLPFKNKRFEAKITSDSSRAFQLRVACLLEEEVNSSLAYLLVGGTAGGYTEAPLPLSLPCHVPLTGGALEDGCTLVVMLVVGGTTGVTLPLFGPPLPLPLPPVAGAGFLDSLTVGEA
ncbi:hypothetical protein JCGZ_24203 [Jatropha curcas]|uniref:GRF-type domain-containing protein n=1 Tax=Jatropha curcas TaxID=180498 RepID=A0A067L4G2_JATCU|nr:hypothetical protein JCGZ_24203 [Jatropha curcas]